VLDLSHRLRKRLVRITTELNSKQVTWHEEVAQSVCFGHRSEGDFSMLYRAKEGLKSLQLIWIHECVAVSAMAKCVK